jgi:hypothetical protein
MAWEIGFWGILANKKVAFLRRFYFNGQSLLLNTKTIDFINLLYLKTVFDF